MAKTDKNENDGTEITIKGVRLSFSNLFKPGDPQKNDEGEMVAGKYGCNFLVKKGTPAWTENYPKIVAAAKEAKIKQWGADPKKWPTLKPEKLFWRDGNLEDYNGYEGCWFVSARNSDQPLLLDNTKEEDERGRTVWKKLTATNGGPKKLYPGCYVNAIIRVWAQDHPKYGKRLNCSVESVQYAKKGEAFSGRKPIDPSEAFADVEEAQVDEDEVGAADEDSDGLI